MRPTSSRSLCLPPARAHFCTAVARLNGGTSSPSEVRLERHHAGHGEQHRRVVRDQAGRRHHRVAALGEEPGERPAQLVGGARRRGHGARLPSLPAPVAAAPPRPAARLAVSGLGGPAAGPLGGTAPGGTWRLAPALARWPHGGCTVRRRAARPPWPPSRPTLVARRRVRAGPPRPWPRSPAYRSAASRALRWRTRRRPRRPRHRPVNQIMRLHRRDAPCAAGALAARRVPVGERHRLDHRRADSATRATRDAPLDVSPRSPRPTRARRSKRSRSSRASSTETSQLCEQRLRLGLQRSTSSRSCASVRAPRPPATSAARRRATAHACTSTRGRRTSRPAPRAVTVARSGAHASCRRSHLLLEAVRSDGS